MKINQNQQDMWAKEILSACGDKGNILKITHCATRLRLQLKNQKIINLSDFEKISCVQGIIPRQSELHLVIGIEVRALFNALNEILL